MARKIIHIGLIVFLLVSTAGLTFSLHYCGGELISAAINGEADSCCDNGSCCENKTVHFELKEDFVSVLVLSVEKAIELDVLFPILFTLNANELMGGAELSAIYPDASPPLPLNLHTRLSLLQTYLC